MHGLGSGKENLRIDNRCAYYCERKKRMDRKDISLIERIKVDGHTFHDEHVEPTYINFFFGKNGAGKSTLAEAFEGDRKALIPATGVNLDDYTILVYNQAFIRENFRTYGDLKGVFTLSKENADKREEIDKKIEERKAVTAEEKATAEARDKKNAELNLLLVPLRNTCLAKTSEIRSIFKEPMKKKIKNPNLTDAVLSEKHNPIKHDFATIRALYEIAFDQNAQSYPLFKKSTALTGRYDLSGAALLGKSITSSSDTDFARFMKALNATDWVKNGHASYVVGHSEKKCPFCQQKLPESFERDIAECFDEDYQNDLLALEAFQTAYTSKMRQLLTLLQSNMTQVFPKADTAAYEKLMAQFETAITTNIQLIAEKAASPAKMVELRDTDALITSIDTAIDEINKQIKANNDIVSTKQDKQLECTRMVWELIAFLLKDDVAEYRKNKKEIEEEVGRLDKKVIELQGKYRALSDKITELNAEVINTKATVDSINAHLKDSGFEGFSLREKEGVKGTYEVVRENDKIAENLSEGERNFIAFLYFFHLVQGSQVETDSGKDKIVVIDDPVSSMDSSAMFIVGALVRELIGVCSNNISGRSLRTEGTEYEGKYIQQIFVLTHNAFFHQEITYNMVSHFRYVSFFKINKRNNVSTVEPCIIMPTAVSERPRNYNPVQNSYHALWAEYHKLDAPIPLMNIIRRILEYYFLQLCGYDGEELTNTVLKRIKEKTEGEEDSRLKYHLAQAMLFYIRRSSTINDGQHFVDESIDGAHYKDVFCMIFEVMGQPQHYEMMMRETE